MPSPDLYLADEYRTYLRAWLESQVGSHGIKSQICKAMGCQNSHLSHVLNQKVHLTMDQAYRLTSFLGFDETQRQFFLKLVEHDRAADPRYRDHLRSEMNAIKREQEDLAKRFKKDRVGNFEREMIYYSSWHWIAVHYITEIQRYREPAAIAKRLQLDEHLVRMTLETLERFQLIKRNGNSWELNSDSLHLPKDSPMNSMLHGNWRTRAVLDSQDRNRDGLHFTAVQTLSVADFEKVRRLILKTIDDYRALAEPSLAEDLICFSCDFFRV